MNIDSRVSPGASANAQDAKISGARAERVPAAIRQARILGAFERDGYVSIASLTEELGVSGMTIRRDVTLLESRGVFMRTHGGAIALTSAPKAGYDDDEPAFDHRMRQNAAGKASMAAAAAALIGPGESVGMDVGTSVLALADRLVERHDLRIFTNNLRVGLRLAESRAAVYLLGGQIRLPEHSVTGRLAVEGLQDHFLDRVFIGVSGIDASGLYDYSPEDTEVKRAFMAGAGQVVVLCDGSKFGRRAVSRVAPLAAAHILITDAPPPDDLAAALAVAGARVIIAH